MIKKTTLNAISKHCPCSGGWETLLNNLNKTEADDEPLSLMTILESNGIKDAVWALRCFDYLDFCLFLADVAESILHKHEESNDPKAPRLAIQAIRDYKLGKIGKEQLIEAAEAAESIVYQSYVADAAFYYTDATDTINAAAYSAPLVSADARSKKWKEIEIIFIKHFNGE